MNFRETGKLVILFVAFFAGFLISGCGNKYPMPPISSDTGMPPESAYVSIEIWDTSSQFNDLFVGSNGLVYVIRNDSVVSYYLNGQRNASMQLNYEFHGAVSGDQAPDGSIWVLDTSASVVAVFSDDGNIIKSISNPDFSSAVSIAVGDSVFYLSFRGNNLVLAYDTVGNIIDTFAREGNGILNVVSPAGLYLDRQRQALFIASSGHNWVEGITVSFPHTNIYHLGGIYHDGGTDDTLFLDPLDVAVDDDGNVYVADSGNAVIKKFSPDGTFIVSASTRNLIGYPYRLAVSFTGKEIYALFSDGNLKWLEKFKKSERPDTTGGGA